MNTNNQSYMYTLTIVPVSTHDIATYAIKLKHAAKCTYMFFYIAISV